MLSALKNEANVTRTENGAAAYRSTFSHCLDLFAQIGAIRHRNDGFANRLFSLAYIENPDFAMRILFYARDIRFGLGERRVFRDILRHAAFEHRRSIEKNIHLIAEYGRFDDLLALFDTPCEAAAMKYIADCFRADMKQLETEDAPVSLLAKWLPSPNASSAETVAYAKRIRRGLCLSESKYRRALSALRRRIDILENHLRERSYDFRYSSVPSQAMVKYNEAFRRNDGARFSDYLRSVYAGKEKMNASTVEPYQIVDKIIERSFSYTQDTLDAEALDAMWRSLPDYTSDEDSIAVVDGSGSMYWHNNPTPFSVAMSLGLYFAEHNKGAFRNHFITFSSFPKLVEVKGGDIVDKVCYCRRFSECSNTNVERVFDLLLSAAVKNGIPKESMPAKIYIISDMEFDCCTNADLSHFENAGRRFEQAGYKLPTVVFWNVEGRNGHVPVRRDDSGAVLVGGCTPRLFKLMASGEDVTPYTQMLEILESERYAAISA